MTFRSIKKNYTKYGYSFLVVLLFIMGAFLRIYNFNDRLIFGPEQGMSLMTSADNLEKFTLLGETNFQRATSNNHIPFHGAYYSYLLLPFLLIFNFRVLPISVVFVALNLFTGLVLFLVSKKLFGNTVAILSLLFFLLSDKMIHHSLFPWILNPLPLLGILTLLCLANHLKNRKHLWPSFWLGVMGGFGFGLQTLYLPFAFLTLGLFVIFSKRKLATIAVFLLGAILGNLPMVIFDLRHDFYHVRTMWQYFLDVFVVRSVSGFTDYYHFLHLYPYLLLIYAFVTSAFYKISKPLALLPILIFLNISFNSPFFDLSKSTGMPEGITLRTLESAAATIAADQPPEIFNLVTLWDFDTVARPMRYLLKYYYQESAQGFENYANVDAIYVFAPTSYDVDNPKVWELRTFLPYQVKSLPSPSAEYSLYKLTK